MMDPTDDDFVSDEPLGSEHARTRRRRRRPPSVLEPPPRRREQIRSRAGSPRERTELFLRENPVPIVLGALTIGLAIALVIRYASRSDEKEAETKTPFGRINWSLFTLPFLWPLLRDVKGKLEDSAGAVKTGVRNIDVDRYTKPIRKRWKSWTS